jgi:glycerate kinase
MKIVIAPDSFKESLTSLEVASELEAGFRRVWPDAEYVKVPMADGGEGTVQSLVAATGGKIIRCTVTGPLGKKVLASYGLLGDGRTAVIEMAEASGLPLVPRAERDPLRASTFGTGELVADAISRGVDAIIIGIGGSATNDGGAGFAQALGVRFIGADGAPIADQLGGGRLDEVVAIDAHAINPGLSRVKVSVACDVTNPLTGDKGASAVYGPQKGATPEMVQRLDRNLGHLAALIKRDLNIDVAERPGAGAGGGMGAALMAFAGGELRSGVELVVAAARLDDHMKDADLAVTGEGRVDFQTAFGKTPAGVAASAKRNGVPVIAIGGGLSEDARGVFEHGIDGLEAATANPMTLDAAIQNSRRYLQDAAERVARLVAIGERMAFTEAVHANGAVYPGAKRNKPVKHFVRAKRVQGLTQAAVALSLRRRTLV